MTSLQKVRNGVDSMKTVWMDKYILIILAEEKKSTSGIKVGIKALNILRKIPN